MSARALREEAKRLGVELYTDGAGLEYEGPEDAITPELLDRLRAYKPQLIKLLCWERRKLEEAERRGLVIRWAKEPGWIALHDPTTGEWHEVKASQCLPGVIETANRHRNRGSAV